MNKLALGSALTVLLASPALADVVHLTNGRMIEGRVVDTREGRVHIEVSGGRMVVPASAVAHIEDCATPEEEYARRARETDMSDPDAVARLASWASARGLGDQAQHLRALSLGLDLERRVGRARRSGRVSDWLDTLRWSRDAGLSLEVRQWLVERAREVDPSHPGVLDAVAQLERDAAPPPARGTVAPPVAPAPSPAGSGAPLDRAAAERLAELERELQQRQAEEVAMKERIAQLEGDRQRRRRRGRPVVVGPAGPCAPSGPILVAPCPPAPPVEAPPPPPPAVIRHRPGR